MANESSPDSTALVQVHYWRGRGCAEPLRMILAAAQVPFVNTFITSGADLAALRAQGKLAYGQVPLVEMTDGTCLVQTQAALRSLARTYGLYPSPSNPADQYLCDCIMEACKDARGILMSFPFALECDKTKVASMFKYDRFAGHWNSILQRHGNKYMLGELPSVADVVVFEVLDFYEDVMGRDAVAIDFKPYPALLAHFNHMNTFGNIAAWKAEREQQFLDWATYATVVRETLDG
ncbi:Aste57867_11835 [Aphanomyces stellatus]|uniref:Aste57867_11835 protein n=1 Tax=Aphanomyces stellatus TaxID=120398 RepID=A0A485KUI6_9STRA|nr:hypothetical protein As57867_011790 [Aphanomyces stellatus]VFT88690.1 Aste57867_11835 [Aphanomyces stellatus]